MEGMLDSFILWSGWIAAVGIAIFEIVKAYRNRIRVEVSLTISPEELCIGVHNWGRRPVNLVEAGLKYANGTDSVYNDVTSDFPDLLYRNDGRNLCFKIDEVVEELKSRNTQVVYGYFADEAGREYKKEASKALSDYLTQLISSGKRSAMLQ